MKYIKSTFILFAMLAVSPFMMNAQTAENESDGDTQVQVAYRTVAEGDLIGSVAVLDYEELTDKNYNTYSLKNTPA